MSDFVTVPSGTDYWLLNATIPATLLTALPPGVQANDEGLVVVDIAIRDAQIAEIVAAGAGEGRPEPAPAEGPDSLRAPSAGGLGGRPEPPI